MSSRFVTGPETDTGEIIETAQHMICEALGLDRSTLWLFSEDGVEMAVTRFWQRQGNPPLRRNILARDNLPWADRQIRDGKILPFLQPVRVAAGSRPRLGNLNKPRSVT